MSYAEMAQMKIDADALSVLLEHALEGERSLTASELIDLWEAVQCAASHARKLRAIQRESSGSASDGMVQPCLFCDGVH